MNSSNDQENMINELGNLLNETAEAHHKLFAATESEDPGLFGMQITFLRKCGKC